MKKLLSCSLLIFTIMLSGCSCIMSTEELEAEQQARKDHIMDVMKERLAEKYGEEYQKSDFEVFDLSKGGNQAWFNYGFYPAKASYKGEEFDVRLKTDGKKRFDNFEDSFYGILYGKDVETELEDIISSYALTDVEIEYQVSDSILKEEADLKANLRVTAKYMFYGDADLDDICGLIDKLDEEGFQNWISVKDAESNRSTSSRNSNSQEIKKYFKK